MEKKEIKLTFGELYAVMLWDCVLGSGLLGAEATHKLYGKLRRKVKEWEGVEDVQKVET